MKYKVILTLAATLTSVSAALAQTPDTTGIYKDRQDSLQATVFTGRQDGNFPRCGNKQLAYKHIYRGPLEESSRMGSGRTSGF